MLNDVHPPPLEPEFDPKTGRPNAPRRTPVRAAIPPAPRRDPATLPPRHLSEQTDRVHELDRSAGRHSEGVDLVYPEPEDRGDSFNTTMSAVVVAVVVSAVTLAVGLSIWWQ